MITSSLTQEIEYKEGKPAIKLLMETEYSKEIRIAMQKGQLMKEHKTPFPIVVEIFEGKIDFGVQGKTYQLNKGDLVSLDGGVSHDLMAVEDSIVRLTLSKSDSISRVKEVPN
ncbi:MAG: cupin domain-containing protein [Cellulophaga sp.]